MLGACFKNLFSRIFVMMLFYGQPPNGMRYLRWGGDGEAVQPEKGQGVENCLGCAQNPQRRVHAVLGAGLDEVRV